MCATRLPSYSVARCNLDPVIFNFYVCLGVFFSSWFVLPFYGVAHVSLGFTAWGFLGGATFVFAVLFSFAAIPCIGLALAQGVWGGAAVLIAFLWGSLGPAPVGKPLRDVPVTVAAVGCLLLGVLGIVFCEEIAKRLGLQGTCVGESRALLNAPGAHSPTEADADMADIEEAGEGDETNVTRLLGLASALLVGLFGGSVLVPLAFVPKGSYGGIAFLPSFGCGALLAGSAVTASYCAWMSAKKVWGVACGGHVVVGADSQTSVWRGIGDSEIVSDRGGLSKSGCRWKPPKFDLRADLSVAFAALQCHRISFALCLGFCLFSAPVFDLCVE